MRIASLTLSLCSLATLAAPAPTLPKAAPCPYTSAEVAAALGVTVKPGDPGEMPFPGGVDYSCSYAQSNGSLTLTISQMVMSAADQQKGNAYYQQTLAGKTTAIPRDPDGARWQLDPYDDKSVALHYLRGTHRITIRVNGGSLKAAAMQPKLLGLRRLP